MTPQERNSSANCNYGHEPIPAKCLNVVYNECTGFSPQPAYCTMVIQPPVQTVPEPLTLSLFGVGLVLIVMMRWRRHEEF
jgi:hypothetical protein